MKTTCEIVKDLLPLYLDGVCSGESKAAVEEHLAACANCRAELQAMQAALPINSTEQNLQEAEAVKNLSKQWKKSRSKSLLKGVLITLLASALLVVAVLAFAVESRIVPSAAMMPGINAGDRVIILKFSYILGKTPACQDVVVFTAPAEFGSKEELLKRVIGTPGDTVEIKDGLVYINGEALAEPYLAEPPMQDYPQVTVPEGCYFMLGDNRNHSRDSSMWSNPFVPLSDIKGKVILRL